MAPTRPARPPSADTGVATLTGDTHDPIRTVGVTGGNVALEP